MKLGIDLGTSNSSVAILDRITEEVVNIKVSTGDEPYDSILRSCALLGDPVKIGSIADSEYTSNQPVRTFIETFKPYLNENLLRSVIKVKDKPVVVGYDYLLQQPIWNESEKSNYIGARFSKTEIMRGFNSFLADILEKSRNTLSNMGEECDGYLIGVPLNAKTHYRFRFLEALKESSPYSETFRSIMQKTTFIPEPVAVSFCFHDKILPGDNKVLVFDYGGGTLDLALLEYKQIGSHVLPVRLIGLSCLDKAGRYIDDVLKQHLMNKYRGYQEIYNSLDSSRKYFEDQQIESIKIKLSIQDSVKERLISGVEVEIDRIEFKKILKNLLTDIDACIEDCLMDANLDAYENIDKVVMSGGSSLIPAVQQHLIGIFGKERIVSLDPNSTDAIETALTGVSRGLARYDHFIEVTGLQVNKYKLWNQKTGEFVNVLGRNVREGKAIYDPKLAGFRAATLAIFYDMIKEEPLICLTGLIYDNSDKLIIKFVQEQIFGVFPEVTVTDANGTLILKMDFSNIPEANAEWMIKNCDWRFPVGNGISWEIPSIPFEAGNFIKIKRDNKVYKIKEEEEHQVTCNYHRQCLINGRPNMCDGRICEDGIVTLRKTGIRDVKKGEYLTATNDWDLSKFVFDLVDANANAQIAMRIKSYEVKTYHNK